MLVVKIVPNTKSGKSASTFSPVLDTLPNVPEYERIYKDCPYESCLIILCSYKMARDDFEVLRDGRNDFGALRDDPR
jgi:hypothetical protein